MRRVLLPFLVAAVALAGGLVPGAARGAEPPSAPVPTRLRAGVGVADMTWHVGAGSGQYSDEGNGLAGTLSGDPVDPYHHATKQAPSTGVQSRLTARALVVEGTNGERVALVKTDNYLAQDLLVRRVAQLLDPALGLGHDRIVMSVTHNHSSPYYSSPAVGVWLFQDVWDVRAFEYQARQIAAAITRAAGGMKPARLGATTVDVGPLKGNIAGRGFADDDGSPYGYPKKFGDHGVVVVRVDDVSGRKPVPLATWMNYGQHPESLDGYGLISADYIGPLERFVDRDTGAPLVFSQGDVGSAEGPYDEGARNEVLPDGTVRAWAHTGYAQAERFARNLADAVVDGWQQLGAGGGTVPMTANVPVRVFDAWVPGPVSHPYPAANACRTGPTLAGDPGVGTAADCTRPDTGGPVPLAQMVRENLEMHGIHAPVPDNYDMPSFGAVEENARLHLQAVRLGDILLASCACEAQVDLVLNLETRTDRIRGNIWDGFDWTASDCAPEPDQEWTCTVDPGSTRTGIAAHAIDHMRDQVHRDARGWDDPLYAPFANSENPADIKGNFTKDELDASTGYALTVGLGHTGDYNGYTVSYREFMSRDHYRKALTSYGPHTADYMVSRLVRMAGALRGGPAYDPLTDEPLGAVAAADEARQTATAATVGAMAGAAYDGYLETLADDVGPGRVVAQPRSITRFAATSFSWTGGGTYVDNPVVRVERLDRRKGWVPFADQSGEVPTMVALPEGMEGFGAARTGSFEWVWTASFEAFDPAPARIGQTPAGQYRFVIEGRARDGGETVPYSLVSEPFTVSRWTGLTVTPRLDAAGRVVVPATFEYPRSYTDSPFDVIAAEDRVPCRRCSFRPWARTGTLASVEVIVKRHGGGTERYTAVREGDAFVAAANVGPLDRAHIAPAGATDTWGERNGSLLEVVR